MAFTDKIKIINSYVPEKVRLFIENNFKDEIKYFKKKYAIEIKMLSDSEFVIPEYRIDLLNKSKKLIKSIENFTVTNDNKTSKKPSKKNEVDKNTLKSKDKAKKSKLKKKIRTLWIRRKKN